MFLICDEKISENCLQFTKNITFLKTDFPLAREYFEFPNNRVCFGKNYFRLPDIFFQLENKFQICQIKTVNFRKKQLSISKEIF